MTLDHDGRERDVLSARRRPLTGARGRTVQAEGPLLRGLPEGAAAGAVHLENQSAVRRQDDGRGVGAGSDAKLAVRQPDRARVDGGQAGDDEGIEPEAEAAGRRRGVLSGQPPDY